MSTDVMLMLQWSHSFIRGNVCAPAPARRVCLSLVWDTAAAVEARRVIVVTDGHYMCYTVDRVTCRLK